MIRPDGDPQRDPDPLIALAKSTFLTRKLRGELFDEDLFGEPAWDILLVLFATESERAFSVEDLVAEIGLTHASTRRWLRILEGRDLVSFDGMHAELTHAGRKGLKRYLARQVGGLMQMLAVFRPD